MTELVSDVPISDAVGALAPSEALPVDDVSNAVTQIKQQRDLSLKGSLNQAVTIDPDKAAKNQALADKTGVPIDVINRNEEAIQQRARANDLRALVSTSPILEQQMMNPQFAALAHDDAENLNIFERTLRTYLGASTKSGLEQLLGVGAKLLDVATQGIGIGTSEQEGAVLFKGQPAELKKFQEGPAMFLTRFTKAMQEASTLSMKNLSPAAQLEYGDLRYATLESSKAAYLSPIKVVGDAIQSLPTSLALGVSVYLTKGVAARTEAAALGAGMSPTLAREAAIHAGAETMARLGAATEGAAGYGQQYMQTRQQADEVTDEQLQQSPQYQQLVAAGYSPEAARLRLSAVAAETSGAAGGAIDAITNYFGGRFLGTILTEGGRVAARTAKGFATEALTEAVQSGGEQLAQNVAVQHYLNPAQETLDQVAENIAQGFVVGGVTGGAFSAVAGAKYRQEAATHDAAVLTKLSELAANSELRARAPETFAQFVNAAAADGPVEAVWIDAKGFAQSMVKAGMDEAQLAQKMPETAAALPDALATDGKVRIPTGEFMATFPGTGIEKELIQQLSTTPEGPTAAEAHDAAFIEDSKRQVEAVLAKQEFTNAVKESMGSVERELLAQLTTANRFTKDVNTAYAKLMASFYTVMSQRVGLTPEQMYVKYPLHIQAESVTAPGTLNQPRSSTAVGYWEGPGGEHTETDHVPGIAERAVELGQHDRRWHRYPNAPAVFKSNRQGTVLTGPAETVVDPNDPNILHQLPVRNEPSAADLYPNGNPIFYSALQRQVEALKITTAPAEEWKKAINSLMSKGVKKAEIEASGVMEWLDTAPGFELVGPNGEKINVDEPLPEGVKSIPVDRISRNEVLAYLHSDGETEVRTTIFGEAQQPTDIIQSDEENGVSEEQIEQRAEQLWRDQLQEEAERYASEDDYYIYSDPLVRTPNYRIEKLPADMLRGKDQYGVKELVWDVPTGKEMPDNAEELASMYPGGPREKWLEYFGTEAAAEAWAQGHEFEDGHTGYNGKPYWTSQDDNGDEIGEYDDKSEAEAGIQSHKEQDFQYAVESYIDNASWSEADQEHFIREAREELTDETPRERNQRLERGNVLKLRHEDSYQLPGGKEQTELVVWVPGIEPYAASDTTHFGDVGQGRAIAWARLSQFDDANGKPVLMVNELQSLRAQAGREEGFSGELIKQFVVLSPSGIRLSSFETHEAAQRYMEHNYSKAVREQPDEELRPRIEERAEKKASGVPSAPFVKDTQAWVTLDMKRVIRYAVDNGLDTVTWTTGKQQVGIYTNALRSEIKELKWKKTADGIEITADGRNVNRTFSDKELRVAAGGAITDQIVNSKEQEGTISGQNIRFEAVWPYSFYGDEKGYGPLNQKEIDALKKAGKPIPESKPSIITAATEKILASIGGGKVESIPVVGIARGETPWRFDVHDAEGNLIDQFLNEKLAQQRAVSVGGTYQPTPSPSNLQPGFRITPEMKKAVLGGFAMFQGEGKRGQISFGEGMGISPTTITLLQNADLSTFLHESGHFYLEVMSHMATQENAAPEIVQDMQRILKWFGVPNADVWNAMTLDEKRPYHEQFARGFESYLFEGTAPSPELKSVFARFRAWMLNVYRQLGSLNVQLTDEVRGVFDRMLASNNEIIAAENQRGFAPLFDDAAKMGASPDEWKNYQEQGTAATQDAVDKLQTRSLRDMKWLSNARSAVLKQLQASVARLRKGMRAEVAKEVNAQPIYQAMRWLKFGETTSPEGEAVKATQGFKLDVQALAVMYPPTMLARPDLSKLGVGKYGMTGAEGLDPNLVAEMFGFGSGDELVRKLIDAEPARSVIEGMTDQRMLERYGDLTSQQAISAAADKAVHNELRARVLATELNALTRATGQKKLLTKAAREFAAAMIARKKLRDIRPAQFESAEARSARATEKALAAGKLVEAATEKRNELVNNYAAKAAHAALDEIAQGVAYLRKVADSKTIDPAYREQITAMLERFDLRQTTLKEAKRKASLLEWMESQKDQGFEPVIDPEIANEAMRMPYQEMTMEQFRGLTDSVRNIEHLGRLKFKLLKIADQREFAATVDEAVTAITDNAKKTVPQRLEGNTWSAKMKDGVTEFFAMHRKFASLWREMDGFTDGGKLWQLFVRPMNDAGNTETTMREQATIAMQRIFKPLFDQGGLKTKTFIPAINASLSREGRLMVALNTGNDGNLQRLMDGDHWTKAQVDAIVDTLSKPEMDFVQSIWDMVGRYKQQIGEQQKRLTGVAPEWVEPRQVVTRHGVYAGGYLPAKYDTTRSTRALADEAAAGIMDQWRGARGLAKTRDSFTKERASKVVNRPLRKDFGVITQHVTEVIHRLSWQEYLTDANRLLRSKGIDNAIREHYGHQTLEALRNTLEDVATGELPAQNAFERSINYIRQGATIAGLGWRLTTALLQPFGLTQSMVRIGPTYVAKGLAEWMGDSVRMENTAARIYEKSEFMRLRAKTLQREINEIRNQVEGKNSALTASYFYLITKMQLVADIPTWLGQYHKAIESGADEYNARAQADQAVIDAQGSGQLKDLAAIQRGGPMLKLFTNFYSFFNTTYNMTSEAFGRTNFKNPLSIGRLMVDVLLLYSVPAALGTFMKAALHSGDDTPDWEDKLVRQLIADQMTYWLGTMVGLREISGAAQTALGLSGDYQGPASVRLFASIAELGKQINQGEIDEALFKAIDNVGGVLFHYPAGQINATVDGIVTMAQGKTDNPGALIVGSNRK